MPWSITTSHKVDFTTSGGIWWEELGRNTLSVAGDTLTVSGITAKRFLKIIVYTIASGNIDKKLRFNNDSGNNYAFFTGDNGGAASATTSTNGVAIIGSFATTDLFEADIVNVSAQAKIGIGHRAWDGGAGATLAPYITQNNFKWQNTASQITRVDCINSQSGDYAIGSFIVVLGHD